ncbi:MAG: carbohydrate ABC transporter permease [Aristaeellaceae bacterium]
MTAIKQSARPPKSRLRQEGMGYTVFTVVNTILLILICIVTLYPMYYVVIASISEADVLGRNFGLLLFPVGKINTYSYQLVFRNSQVITGFGNTLFILVAGLCVNMVLTCLGAYFLALKGSMLSRPIAMLILFTMYFSGGIVPDYLNIQSLGLMDSLWALIIPVSISTYNLLIMRSAFSSVPDSLVEAAKLDGASHVRILTQVFLPLSGATLAVMVLYYGVGHWNAWFRASLFIHDTHKYPLQLVLRQILLLNQNSELAATSDAGELAKYADSIKYALIVISSAPILVLYPFLQRFFAKGVMVGALKG